MEVVAKSKGERLCRPNVSVPSSSPGGVELKQVRKAFGPGAVAIHDFNLTIAAGEFVALLGPSGSGKTTTLMIVAGFTNATSGDIFISGRSMSGVPPEQRGIGVVFQNYALFPHLSVERNISFPLEMRSYSRSKISQKVAQTMELVGLEELGSRYPHQLSGGQQQRVALARALVFQPSLLLMDEPFGALDKHLRERMRLELRSLHRTLRTTILFVTHDQGEALALADRVALINHGRLEQIDTPSRLYAEPHTRFVAGFIGDCNFLTIDRATRVAAHWTVDIKGYRGEAIGPGPEGPDDPILAVRPHVLRLNHSGSEGLPGRIVDVVFMGEMVEYLVALDWQEVIVRYPAVGSPAFPISSPVSVGWDWSDARVL